MLPHLDAAHNLARWLTGNEANAQDAVQEAYLRAFRFFDGYQGGDERAWLLAIVRNACRNWANERQRAAGSVPFDEATHTSEDSSATQEELIMRREKTGVLRRCIEMLPADFREVLIMRELEEMSYREIAAATGQAIGTVMSRLSRARKRLGDCAARRRTGTAG